MVYALIFYVLGGLAFADWLYNEAAYVEIEDEENDNR